MSLLCPRCGSPLKEVDYWKTAYRDDGREAEHIGVFSVAYDEHDEEILTCYDPELTCFVCDHGHFWYRSDEDDFDVGTVAATKKKGK
jgi:hypothetical protein